MVQKYGHRRGGEFIDRTGNRAGGANSREVNEGVITWEGKLIKEISMTQKQGEDENAESRGSGEWT